MTIYRKWLQALAFKATDHKPIRSALDLPVTKLR